MSGLLACTDVSSRSGEALAGTAPLIGHLVGVTLPLPWPAKILNHPMLEGLDSSGMTIIGLVDESRSDHLVVSYRSGDSARLGPLLRNEQVVETHSVIEAIEALTNAGHHPITADDPVDLLICAHGTRDRCCGSSGTVLHMEMLAKANSSLRIWRASHLGGHRFAPTVITLPDGLCWGNVDAENMVDILNQSIESELAYPLFRGHIGATDHPTQAADGLMFSQAGWDWLGRSRLSNTRKEVSSSRVTFSEIDGQPLAEFEVTELARVPVPVCGEPIEASVKSHAPLAVQRV